MPRARRTAAIGAPLISTRTAAIESLSIDAVAVMKRVGVLGEQHQIVGGGNLGDDRASQRALGVARALPPAPVELQRRREAGGDEEQQRDGDDAGDEVTH